MQSSRNAARSYSLILFILTDNITVSRGGEGEERDQRYMDKNHSDNTNYYIIPFVIKTGNEYMGNGGDGGWGEEVSTSLKEILRLLETPKSFFA